MNPNNIIKGGAAGGVAGVAIAGAISAPMLIAGAIGLVAVGGLCTIFGVLASNSKEANIQVNRDGFEGNFKK